MAKKVKITCSQCGKDIFGFKEGGGITVKYKDRMLRIEPGGNVTFVCRICGAMTVVNLQKDRSEENQELGREVERSFGLKRESTTL